jgi:hypothetical protein
MQLPENIRRIPTFRAKVLRGFSLVLNSKWFYHSLPYKIFNQPDQEEICYDIDDDMELVFTFLPIKKKNANLVWRWEVYLKFTSPLIKSI